MLRTGYRFEVKKSRHLLVVTLFGEIDHHSAVGLRSELDELILKERPARFLLDLGAIEFMDSSGLGLLMGRFRLMKDLGGEMALQNPAPRVLKMLRLSGMERFMEINGAR